MRNLSGKTVIVTGGGGGIGQLSAGLGGWPRGGIWSSSMVGGGLWLSGGAVARWNGGIRSSSMVAAGLTRMEASRAVVQTGTWCGVAVLAACWW